MALDVALDGRQRWGRQGGVPGGGARSRTPEMKARLFSTPLVPRVRPVS